MKNDESVFTDQEQAILIALMSVPESRARFDEAIIGLDDARTRRNSASTTLYMGKLVGLSPTRISQIERIALRKLKLALIKKLKHHEFYK